MIVPFRGDALEAQALLDRLSALRTSEGDELIVADNTPGGGLPDVPEGIRMVAAPHRRSSYHARNEGARLAANEWLLFMDADCIPPVTLLDDYFADPPDDRCGVVA